MGARLAYSVRLDGETVVAGTEATPELRERITNPAAWEGESESESKMSEASEDSPPSGRSTRKSGTGNRRS